MFRLLVAGESAIAGKHYRTNHRQPGEGHSDRFRKPEEQTKGFQQTAREKDLDARPTSVLAASLIQVEEHRRP